MLLSLTPSGVWPPKLELLSLRRRQGAIQFAFGPPPDANEKSYAIETMLPPVHLGGPSLEELQEGQIKLVPGTYQIAFDEE